VGHFAITFRVVVKTVRKGVSKLPPLSHCVKTCCHNVELIATVVSATWVANRRTRPLKIQPSHSVRRSVPQDILALHREWPAAFKAELNIRTPLVIKPLALGYTSNPT